MLTRIFQLIKQAILCWFFTIVAFVSILLCGFLSIGLMAKMVQLTEKIMTDFSPGISNEWICVVCIVIISTIFAALINIFIVITDNSNR